MAIVSVAIIAVLTLLDQLLKMLVVTYLKPVGTMQLIPGLLQLNYVENSGASFGMFPDMSWLFAGITVVFSAAIIYMLFTYKQHSFFSRLAGILIVAGGFGNLIDRIVFQYVIDYIHVEFFDFIFNFADCCVVIGVIALIVHIIWFMDKKRDADIAENGKED